jgi:hypothetical protein
MFDVSPTPRHPTPPRQSNPIAQAILIVVFGAMMLMAIWQIGQILSTPQVSVLEAVQPTVGVEVRAAVEVIMPTSTPEPTATSTATPQPSLVDLYGACSDQSRPEDVCVMPTKAPSHTADNTVGTPITIGTCDKANPGALCVIPTPAAGTGINDMVD